MAGLEVNDCHGRPTPREFVERVVTAVRAHVERPDLGVSLLLTGEAEIAAIHDRFLGDPTATDVISFPMGDSVDVVVSVERAENEARARGHTVEAELALYIVHGILHVCGYDDVEASDRLRMRRAESEVLAALGYSDISHDPG